MLLSKNFWKPVLWWNVTTTNNIEYYDIQYAPDRTEKYYLKRKIVTNWRYDVRAKLVLQISHLWHFPNFRISEKLVFQFSVDFHSLIVTKKKQKQWNIQSDTIIKNRLTLGRRKSIWEFTNYVRKLVNARISNAMKFNNF